MNWAEAGFHLFGLKVLWTDFVGSLAALVPVLLAMRRSIWNWPIQFVGAILLLIAYANAHLTGSALKNAMMAILAVYGWWKWRQGTRDQELVIRRATPRERARLIAAVAGGTALFGVFLYLTGLSWGAHTPAPGSYFLVAADAYIFVGGAVATYAMSRALVDFWIIWLLVDLVGVPLAFRSGLYFNGSVYAIFFVTVLYGFADWRRQSRVTRPVTP